jgi:hypothetical protein
MDPVYEYGASRFAARFNPLTPVLMPGLKGAPAVAAPAPEEEEGPAGFKAY